MRNKTLTRADLANALQYNVGLSKAESSHFVKLILDEITQALVNNDNVKISSFGSFQLREKQIRMGRNPKTGAAAEIPAHKTIAFKASIALKEEIEKAG